MPPSRSCATCPTRTSGFAKIDHHRGLRDALPEVVLAQGKTPEQVAAIGQQPRRALGASSGHASRRARAFAPCKAAVPDAAYDEMARVATVERQPRQLLPGVTVVCAGTSDLPVAEEAAITAALMGQSDADRDQRRRRRGHPPPASTSFRSCCEAQRARRRRRHGGRAAERGRRPRRRRR